MNYSIKLLQEINLDIVNAVNWDKEHRPYGESRIISQLAETIDYLGSNPKLFPRTYKDIRMAQVSLYPFNVFFTINETTNQVVILAIIQVNQIPKIEEKRSS